MNGKQAAKVITVTLNTHGQSIDSIKQVVSGVFGRGGCLTCGRGAVLRVEFQVDPPPELAQAGVISMSEEN